MLKNVYEAGKLHLQNGARGVIVRWMEAQEACQILTQNIINLDPKYVLWDERCAHINALCVCAPAYQLPFGALCAQVRTSWELHYNNKPEERTWALSDKYLTPVHLAQCARLPSDICWPHILRRCCPDLGRYPSLLECPSPDNVLLAPSHICLLGVKNAIWWKCTMKSKCDWRLLSDLLQL